MLESLFVSSSCTHTVVRVKYMAEQSLLLQSVLSSASYFTLITVRLQLLETNSDSSNYVPHNKSTLLFKSFVPGPEHGSGLCTGLYGSLIQCRLAGLAGRVHIMIPCTLIPSLQILHYLICPIYAFH